MSLAEGYKPVVGMQVNFLFFIPKIKNKQRAFKKNPSGKLHLLDCDLKVTQSVLSKIFGEFIPKYEIKLRWFRYKELFKVHVSPFHTTGNTLHTPCSAGYV